MRHGEGIPVLFDGADARSRIIARLSLEYLDANTDRKDIISARIQHLIDGGPLISELRD